MEMKLINRVLPVLICMLLVSVFFPITASAEAEVVAGDYFGNGLKWEIEYEDKGNFEEDITLIIIGSGAMPDLSGPNDAPWTGIAADNGYIIDHIVISEGITAIGDYSFANSFYVTSVSLPAGLQSIGTWAFGRCESLGSIVIPSGCVNVGGGAFQDCIGLASVIISDSCRAIGDYAFAGCTSLRSVSFGGDAPAIGELSFQGVTSAVWCSCLKEGWDEYTMLQYGAEKLTWSSHAYDDGVTVKEAACTEDGVRRYTCSLCENSFDEAIPAKGHTIVIDPAIEPGFDTEGLSEGSHCSVCGEVIKAQEIIQKTGYVVDLSSIPEGILEINGAVCDRSRQIVIDGRKPGFAIVYVYGASEAEDQTKQYPISMRVFKLSLNDTDHTCTAVELNHLSNLLEYKGVSIRVTGVSGIRIITSISESLRTSLIEEGLEGYKLSEYGTIVQWESVLSGAGLTFATAGDKRGVAFRQGETDCIFSKTNGSLQYTSVISNIPDDCCGQDLAMRPYMILKNSDGDEIVFYGGTVSRSVGFIALQNKNAFALGTSAYEYIWKFIRTAYGNAYDSGYGKK